MYAFTRHIQQEIGIMSVGTNPGDGHRRLFHICFNDFQVTALRLQVGHPPRFWLSGRGFKAPSDDFRTGEMETRDISRSGIDEILQMVPAEDGFWYDFEKNGIAAFYHPEFPVIVYAEKRDGEIELFIHREPRPAVPGDEEEE